MEMNAHAQAFQISVVLCFAAPGSLISQMAAWFQMSLMNPRPELRVGDLSQTWMDLLPVLAPCLIIFCALFFLNGSIHLKTWLKAHQHSTSLTFSTPIFFHHLAPLPSCLHCPPLLSAVPPPIVHFGN